MKEAAKFDMFKNRLSKVYKHLAKTARKQQITCFRIYDHDLPEFPFIIEKYDDKINVSEYKRKHSLTEEAHMAWQKESVKIISETINIPVESIYVKSRKRKEGREGQYRKSDNSRHEFMVQEGDLNFIVNLSDYLDTGLFLDHRITRQMVRNQANGKRVLNLFAYTGSFSVYAAVGNAAEVTTVDLSNTYINWAKRNLGINGFTDQNKYKFIVEDVLQYLKNLSGGEFDLIIMDPPTFSNSKKMNGILDIQRDHVNLINDCLAALAPGGQLYFSNNYSKFILDENAVNASSIKNITKATTPFDFEGKLNRSCYIITK